ncbi:MAG TPA: hypothetical protein VIM11_12850 [Tepidisphaeraceae bacterium]|jgi:hypothetical protein
MRPLSSSLSLRAEGSIRQPYAEEILRGIKTVTHHKRTGRIIKLLTVQEILDKEHVQKM